MDLKGDTFMIFCLSFLVIFGIYLYFKANLGTFLKTLERLF